MKRTFCTIIRDESAEGVFGLMSLYLSGGEFYTPRSEVRGLVEMLEQCAGRIYAPCCGSGSMFMQSENSWKSTTAASSTSPSTGQESNYPSAAVQDEPSGVRHHQRRHPLEQKVAFRGPS